MPKTSYNEIVDEGGESKYIKFPQGDTRLRIVSEVYNALRHKAEFNGKWKNIACPKTLDSNNPCPLCESDQPKMQWVVKVIDRTNNKIKILEGGTMIFGQLRTLSENDEYGDPQNYDITINRIGEKLNTEYKVIAARQNTELTEAEKKLVAEDSFDLELYTTPRPIEEIQQIIDGEEPEHSDPNDNQSRHAQIMKGGMAQTKQESEINVEDIPFN